jgi:uncharacterized membrane protein
MSFTWTDEKTERVIGNLLRTGVLLSAFVVLGGGIFYLVQHNSSHTDYHNFHGQPQYLCTVNGVISSAVKLDSRGIIQLGLLLLVLTPIARVLLSAVSFGLEGDFTYVGVSLLVLAILIYGLLGS